MPARLTISKTWFGPAPTITSGGEQPQGFGDPPGAPSRMSPTVVVCGEGVRGAVATVFEASPVGTYPSCATCALAWSEGCWPCEWRGAGLVFVGECGCA